LLHALHWSFSGFLLDVERNIFLPALASLIEHLRARLSSGVASQWGAHHELDLYLTVALRLLHNEGPGPDEDGPVEEVDPVTALPFMRPPLIKQKPLLLRDSARIDALLTMIYEANGVERVTLFGVERRFDFSLFAVRGSYGDDAYFRLVNWLRHADLRICYLSDAGDWVLSRDSLYSLLALRELLTEEARQKWMHFATLLRSLLGPFDGMTLFELDALFEWLGSPTHEALVAMDEQTLLQKLLEFPLGRQKITGAPIFAPTQKKTRSTPLPLSFSLVGGVYAVDSFIFSSLVFNRVAGGMVHRMMPSPLDIAFSVFQNKQAKELLADELAKYPYAEDLLAAEKLASQDEPKSLRACWIRAIKSLSETAKLQGPSVTKTESFGRRILQTQLSSWAELRRDTILYEKQSRSFGIICSFPDVYVEPNPEFFAALEEYARFGKALKISTHFDALLEVSGELKKLSLQQQRGERPTTEQLHFVNRMLFLKEPEMCRPREADGWLISLYGDKSDWGRALPVIADVHTQDTDEHGGQVGRVLHVATGYPRLLVLTVDDAKGSSRAFFGLSSSYFELVTERYHRLDDVSWWRLLDKTIQPVWLQDVSVGEPLSKNAEVPTQDA
jgi:hypothetical protein